jgi:hypothetical protein
MKLFVEGSARSVEQAVNLWLLHEPGKNVEVIKTETSVSVIHFPTGVGADRPTVERIAMTIWYEYRAADAS